MLNLLEAFKQLNKLNLEEEIDENLYANYVSDISVFINVLKNGWIMTNWDQKSRGSKDWDVRGNHICLTQDILNPPRIMKNLRFGVVFDKEKFIKLAENNLVNINPDLVTANTREVNKFLDTPHEESVISPHDDVLYRMTFKEKVNGIKNLSDGMNLRAIIQYKNGKRSLVFNNWTERFFPNDQNIKINDVEFTPNLKDASDSLWIKIESIFKAYRENNSSLFRLHKLGNIDGKSEDDIKYANIDYPKFNSEVIDYAYVIGALNIKNLGVDNSYYRNSSGKAIDRKLCLRFRTLTKNYKSFILAPGQNPDSNNEITSDEIFVLAKMILPEHEFRLYLQNLSEIFSKEEISQLISANKTLSKKKISAEDKEEALKTLYNNPKLFYKFDTTDCVVRIILPVIYDFPISNKYSGTYIKLKDVFNSYYSSMISEPRSLESFKSLILEKCPPEFNLADDKLWKKFVEKMEKSTLTNQELYILLKYFEPVGTSIIPSEGNLKRDLDTRHDWYQNGFVTVLNQCLLLKKLIKEKYPNAEVRFYQITVKDLERFADYVD